MSRARLVIFVSMVAFTAQVAVATDGHEASLDSGVGFGDGSLASEVTRAASVAVSSVPKPSLYPGLPEPICEKLEGAFSIAIEHLEQHATCQGLFDRFGADGIDLLTRTLYVRLTAIERHRYCGRGAVALTAAGGRVTKPCPGFSRLSDERGAVTLIHEALHVAGQPEAPYDRGAPTSFGITQMVIANCGF